MLHCVGAFREIFLARVQFARRARVNFFLAKAKPMVPVKALSFVIHTLGRNAQDFVVTRSELSIA